MLYGVGLIGAGPGVASLHVPTVARLAHRFRVVHISDSGSGRAADIAAPFGARSSTGEADLLADDAVDVVAICSPPSEHARQILAAVDAGVRGILCEKPLALTELDAQTAIDACRDAGVALVVGTNHLFDPAWGRAKHYLDAIGSPLRSITITAVLPPNGRYHALVSEPHDAPGGAAGRPLPDWRNPEVAAAVLRQLVLGLAIHDLPALRDLAPRIDRVVYARPVPPVGYAIGALAGDTVIQLNAVMVAPGTEGMWRLAITTDQDRLDVDFPPPFVHDGSASVRVRDAEGRLTAYAQTAADGYLEEWDALADMLALTEPVEYDQLFDDALYAISFADGVAACARGERS